MQDVSVRDVIDLLKDVRLARPLSVSAEEYEARALVRFFGERAELTQLKQPPSHINAYKVLQSTCNQSSCARHEQCMYMPCRASAAGEKE